MPRQQRLDKKAVLSLSRCPVFIASDLSGFVFSSPAQFGGLPPSSLWECGNPAPWAGFPSAEGRAGNSFWEFSALSSARHFHSVARALFPISPGLHPPPCSAPPRGVHGQW